MAVFTAIAATISAISAWTVSLGAFGTFAIGNFLLRAAVQLGVSALAMAFSKKGGSTPFSIQGSVRTGGSVPRSFVLGPGLSAGSLVWHSEWGEAGGTPNAYYTQVIALSDLPVAGLNRWFIEGRAVTLEDTGDERGLAAVEYREGEKDHAWIRFHDGTQLFADEFLTGTVNSGAPRAYEATRVGRGIAYAVVTFRVNAEIFTGFPTSKFVLNGVKLYDISKDSSQGGSGSQRWDAPQSWGGDGDALPAVQAYNLARGFYYRDPGAAGGIDETTTIALGTDKSTLSLKLVGGGGGGLTNANGAATTVTLKDGATILQTWTAAGGMARAAADHIGVASEFAPHGNGADGQKRIFAAGEGGGEVQPEIKGGGAGGFVEITAYDLTGLTDPQLEIVIGAGATGAGTGYVLYTADQLFDTIVPQWFYGLQGLSTARLPASHWIAQIEKCRAEIEGEDGLEPIYRCAGEVTVNSEIGSAFEAILTACAGRMSEVGGIFKIYVGAPDAPIAHFSDADILSLAPQSFTPFFGLSDTVNGVVATYPSPDEGYVMRSTPPLYNPNYEIEDGGRRLLTDVQLSFVPFPAQAQRLLTGELAAARRARRHTHSLPARFRLIEPGDVVTWTSTRNGYDAKQFRVDGLIDLPNCDVIVDLTEVDPADHGSWEHASDYVPVVPVPLLPVRPSAQGVVGFQAQAAAVQDSAGQQRRAALVMTWNGTVEDIIGIKFQIRIAGQTSIVSRAQSRDFEEGELLIESGLVAATDYECRAKYITGTARPVSWTAWVAASTQDIRLVSEDFASSIRPPEIVSALPSVGNYEGRLVVFTVDGKLYRFHDGAWTAEVAAVDVTGQMSSSQLAGLETAKLLGTVSSTQIATLAAEKLTGTINQARIAALAAGKITGTLSDSQIAAISATKISGSLVDDQIAGVSALKISGQLTDAQLAGISAAKVAGQLTNAQLGGIEAAKVTGTLSDAQLAGISAAKISGTLVDAQIAGVSALKVSGQLTNAQIADIAAAKVTGTLGTTQIADDAITTPKILSGAIVASKIAAGAITAGKVQAGAIGAAEIAAGAIVASKIAIGDFENLNVDPDFTDPEAWAADPGVTFQTSSSIATWGSLKQARLAGDGGSYVVCESKNIFSVDSDGEEFWLSWRGRIVSGAGRVYVDLQFSNNIGFTGTNGVDYIYRSVGFAETTSVEAFSGGISVPSGFRFGRIRLIKGNDGATDSLLAAVQLRRKARGALIVDGSIVSDNLASNAVTAAKVAAGAIVADKIGASAITAEKIATGAIVAGKIAAGSIVAGDIASSAITAGKISAGAVSAAKIAAGAVTAEKVQAGAIGAAQIAAGAITAEKIAIGDFTNAASGSSGEWDNPPWTITSVDTSIVAVAGRDASGGKAVYVQTGGASTKLVLNKPLSVMAGEEVLVTYWVWVSADFDGDAGNSKLRLGEMGTLDHVASISYVSVTRGSWQRVTGTAVIPGDISEVILEIRANNTAGYAYFDDIVLRKRLTGELIVDGTIVGDNLAANGITSDKIAANAIVADKIAAGEIVSSKIASSAITTAKLEAGAITTAKIAAGAISAEKIAAGSVTATKLAIGGGGNLLENSNWVGGLETVVAQGGAGIHAEHAVSLRSAGLSFSGNYYPTLQFFQNGTTAGQASLYFHKISGGQTHGWPASPGGWYDASVQMRHFRAGGFLRMVFRDASGSWKGSADTAAVSNTGGSDDNPDSWERLWVKAQAPANTASIQLIVYKDGTSSGANSYLFLHKPMIAETHADATEPTPYAVSGATFITGNEILTGAILADHIQAGAIVAGKIAAGSIVAGDIAANTITAAEIKAGAVTASELATGSVAAQHITADAIVAGKIAAGAITSGMGVFSGPLQSDDFATGSAGWRIKKDGAAEFNQLIVRESLTVDAVSDGGEDYVSGAGQYNYDATVVDITFEGQEGDNSVQPNRVFDIAAYWQMRCYGSNTASGNKIPVRGRVQYRLTVGGVTGSWVDVHTSAPALNDTWTDYYYIEAFSFKADYVEFRLTAHPDIDSPSGAYSFQSNFRRIGISAYSVRR